MKNFDLGKLTFVGVGLVLVVVIFLMIKSSGNDSNPVKSRIEVPAVTDTLKVDTTKAETTYE